MSYRLDSIRLKNLRSLRDTGEIKLKPITILVGKNSVGKSTFLRSFPLLRQSCEKQKRAPILWYGKLVDFGDFNTTINRNAKKNKEDNICFSFNFKKRKVLNLLGKNSNFKKIFESVDDLLLTFNLKSEDNITFLSDIELNFNKRKIKLEYGFFEKRDSFLKKISIDETVLFEQGFYDQFFDMKQENFLMNMEGSLTNISQYYLLDEDFILSDFRRVSFTALMCFFNNFLNKNDIFIDDEKNSILSFCAKIYKNRNNFEKINDLDDFLINVLEARKNEKFFNFILDKENVFKIFEILNLDAYMEAVSKIDSVLGDFYKNTRYLEPLRATAQRYYRRQELSVDEIDSKGSNIAMFLDNLNSKKQIELKKFVENYFGVEVRVKKDGGHLALTIYNNLLKTETNIADLGVGYSQLLPFVIQLWDMSNNIEIEDRRPEYLWKYNDMDHQSKFLLIEQPELHLHPAYQIKIVDIIADLVKSHNSQRLGVLLETHSPNIVYRISELIENNVIDSNSVQILIFEDDINGSTEIRHASFDEDGDLINWPTGFFQV
ncbi:DUF3696 domain-containing protein [Acinetobacter bereziniae]|uniref:DUF3696 domain-containing protein n=1 Tax=Acinetobacter bereziniae TaxID=106648 RepID=UPI003AF84022